MYVSVCPSELPYKETKTGFCVRTCTKTGTLTYKMESSKSCVESCNTSSTQIEGNFYIFNG
jgi:hypothetical protein